MNGTILSFNILDRKQSTEAFRVVIPRIHQFYLKGYASSPPFGYDFDLFYKQLLTFIHNEKFNYKNKSVILTN